MKKLTKFCLVAVACVLGFNASAQNYTNPFNHLLLDEHIYDLIVGESSGDRAFNYMMDIAPYERDRSHEDYAGNFFESDYVVNKLKSFGISNAKVEIVGKSTTWDGVSGSLWEVSPKTAKIADYADLAAHLAQGSADADVTAELVWVGDGEDKDFEGLDCNGKIIVTGANASRAFAKAKGAVGAISFYSPRPLRDPIQIPNASFRSPDGKGFCFNIAPRDGYELRDRLVRGEKITVHAEVKATKEETNNEVPTCVIEGTDPNAGEMIFMAHLWEGYVKLGANDNISGAVVLMEVARTLQTLIDNGKIERPKRSVRFIWVNEFSGTYPWVMQNMDIVRKTLCGVNLDMVGLWVSKDGSYLCSHRTLMGNPHYINDVQESFCHYMSATNKSTVMTGVGRPTALKPVYSATGSRDPFYYSISFHYGASDHEVFNDWGIQVPTSFFNTWPDSYYHTSGDRPAVCDPTQLHRMAVIGTSMAYTVANADAKGAMSIASEVAANAGKRMGVKMGDDLSVLAKSNADTFMAAYKKARFNQDAILSNEKATVKSVLELAPDNADLATYVNSICASLDAKSATYAKEIDAAAKAIATQVGVTLPKTIVLTDLEKKASKIYPKTTSKVKEIGSGVQRTVSQDLLKAHGLLNERGRSVVTHTDDIAKLTVEGVNSVLDIHKMQVAQFSDAATLEQVMDYLEVLKEAGLVEW